MPHTGAIPNPQRGGLNRGWRGTADCAAWKSSANNGLNFRPAVNSPIILTAEQSQDLRGLPEGRERNTQEKRRQTALQLQRPIPRV